MADQITKETHTVHADGTESHDVKHETKDGRSLGQKIDDAKGAFKADADNTKHVEKERMEVKDGKTHYEKQTEDKDARTMGEKFSDAKKAFQHPK